MQNRKQEHEGLKQEVYQKHEVLAWHACSISCCSVLVVTMCRYGKVAVAKLTDFLWPFDSFCATFWLDWRLLNRKNSKVELFNCKNTLCCHFYTGSHVSPAVISTVLWSTAWCTMGVT